MKKYHGVLDAVRSWIGTNKLTFSGVRVDKFCEKVKWVDEWQKRLI